MTNRRLKVAVLAGGIGDEREISLQSGRCVAEALVEAGFDVVTADVGPDDLEALRDKSIDVFFPALHGKFGEDGTLQQILEDESRLYTGSGPIASKLAFDKMACKELFEDVGAAVPKAIEFRPESDVEQIERQLCQFAGKCVVKPVTQGSSVGIYIVSTPAEALEAAPKVLDRFGDCMIEEFIPGQEVTVGILGEHTLPIIEIRTHSAFYDYRAKYVDERTEFLFDTVADPGVAADISRAAMDCFTALGCRHFGRIDFILGDDGTAHILEVNTIPGFTTHSLLPKAAARAGLSMSDLCASIARTAYSSTVSRNA
ncbi:MAG: D-alanine--D-alanine ligase [Sedimentisphaerales bacterium]